MDKTMSITAALPVHGKPRYVYFFYEAHLWVGRREYLTKLKELKNSA
jgi:hypothetical protein